MYNTHHNPRLPRNVLAFLFLLHHNPYIHTERYDNLHHIDLVNYSATELPEHLKSGGIPPFFRVRP